MRQWCVASKIASSIQSAAQRWASSLTAIWRRPTCARRERSNTTVAGRRHRAQPRKPSARPLRTRCKVPRVVGNGPPLDPPTWALPRASTAIVLPQVWTAAATMATTSDFGTWRGEMTSPRVWPAIIKKKLRRLKHSGIQVRQRHANYPRADWIEFRQPFGCDRRCRRGPRKHVDLVTRPTPRPLIVRQCVASQRECPGGVRATGGADPGQGRDSRAEVTAAEEQRRRDAIVTAVSRSMVVTLAEETPQHACHQQ
jgi:hypothetical protein